MWSEPNYGRQVMPTGFASWEWTCLAAPVQGEGQLLDGPFVYYRNRRAAWCGIGVGTSRDDAGRRLIPNAGGALELDPRPSMVYRDDDGCGFVFHPWSEYLAHGAVARLEAMVAELFWQKRGWRTRFGPREILTGPGTTVDAPAELVGR